MSGLKILDNVTMPSSVFLPVISNNNLYNIQGNTCFDINSKRIYVYVDGVKYSTSALSPIPDSNSSFDSLIIGSQKIPNNVVPKKGIIDCTVNNANDYSGFATTDNSIFVLGGSNIIGSSINNLLLGFNNQFNGSNSLVCSDQSNINGLIASVLALTNSDISNCKRSFFSGQYHTLNNVDNSISNGYQNIIQNSDSSSILGRDSIITNGLVSNLIGSENEFSGDIAMNNLSNTLIGSKNKLINGLAHQTTTFIGNNINNLPATVYNNTVMIGSGSASSGSIFKNLPNTISPPVGYNNNSLILYGNNLVIGTDIGKSFRFYGGIRYNVRNNIEGDPKIISVSDYYIFQVNNIGNNAVTLYLPFVSDGVKEGQTWFVKNTSDGAFMNIIVKTLDPGNNIFTGGSSVNSVSIDNGINNNITGCFVYDGTYFQYCTNGF